MKKILLLGAMLLCGTLSFAQAPSDPVVMTINGKPVLRSEFEYSYNKNNTDGVIDKKSVMDYVPLFVNYKLKVEAALSAHLDTLASFQNEFAGYRDEQIRPAMIDSTDIEAEARRIYTETQQRIDGNGGMAKVAHILIRMRQKATPDEMRTAKLRIDSIYDALQHGADFATLARKYSQDPGSAQQGGELDWIAKDMTFPDFEKQVWALKKGEMSRPFTSPAGWHIVVLKDRQPFFSYESQRADILRFIDQASLRDRLINNKIDTLAHQQHTTPAKVLEAKKLAMEQQDPNLKYLIQEYHDGLLLYEISNRTVWDKAQRDSLGQERFFKKNKKRYRWDAPRFKGIAYHTRDAADIAAVKRAVKGVPFSQWADVLRRTFNADSVLRIRVEKGIFRKGDNALVDHDIFGVDTVAKPMKDYPHAAVYGRKIKAPREVDDVRQLVITDYQEVLEQQWVEQLRRRYPVKINEPVLRTVNHH